MQDDWLSTRVTMLERRVESLESLLSRFPTRFDAVDEQFASIDSRFDVVDDRFAEIDRRFDAVDERFVAIDRRFDTVDERFAGIDRRFDTLEESVDARFDAVHQVLISLQTQIAENHRHMLVLHEEVISRIATLGERWDRARPRPRKKR